MRVGALGLLRANGPFRRLSIARVISYAGDTLSLVALMLYVSNSAGKAIAVALLLLVGDFAPALLSPLTGAVSDRLNRKHVMIACELAQGAVLLAIALALPPLPVLLPLVALRAALGNTFQPASRAAIPALVDDRDLEQANASLGFAANGAEALGPLLAAALLPLTGIRGVLLIDAASFALSAALLTTLPTLRPGPVEEKHPPFLRSAKAGLTYIWSAPAIRIIIVSFAAVVAFTGIDDVAAVYLIKDTLRAPESTLGLVLGAVGVGIIVGFALLARMAPRLSMPALLLAGFAVSSAGNLLTGLSWAVLAAVMFQTIRGLGIAGIEVASNTLLQRLVPTPMQGRVFGNLGGALGTAAGLSYVAGSLLLNATNAPVTFVVAGTGGLLTAAAAALTLPRALNSR